MIQRCSQIETGRSPYSKYYGSSSIAKPLLKLDELWTSQMWTKKCSFSGYWKTLPARFRTLANSKRPCPRLQRRISTSLGSERHHLGTYYRTPSISRLQG